MSHRIAVSILSDSRLLREALAIRLTQDPLSQFEVVSAASHVHGLLMQLRGRAAETLLVHTDTEAITAGVVWEIRSLLPAARLIVLGFRETQGSDERSGFAEEDAETLRWVEAGALAYLPCATSYATLRETICAVAAGCPTCSCELLLGVTRPIRTFSQAVRPNGIHRPRGQMTFRESEVAQRLGLGRSTADSHSKSVLPKLDCGRRVDLLRLDGLRGIG